MSILCHQNFSYLGDSGPLAAWPRLEPAQSLLHGQLAKLDHFSALGNHSVFQNQPFLWLKTLILRKRQKYWLPRSLEKYKPSKRRCTGFYVSAQSLVGSPWPPPFCRVLVQDVGFNFSPSTSSSETTRIFDLQKMSCWWCPCRGSYVWFSIGGKLENRDSYIRNRHSVEMCNRGYQGLVSNVTNISLSSKTGELYWAECW